MIVNISPQQQPPQQAVVNNFINKVKNENDIQTKVVFVPKSGGGRNDGGGNGNGGVLSYSLSINS